MTPDEIHDLYGGQVRKCGACGGAVSPDFGCSHYGFFREGSHVRHAVCCAYVTRYGIRPVGPLLVGRAAVAAMAEATA